MTWEHNVFERIKNNSNKLSPKQAKLAKYLITNYKAAAFQTVAQMAKESAVSEATVVRLAEALGYSNFTAMLEDMQRIVRHELDAFEHIRYTYKGDALKKLNIVETVVKNEQRNINKLLENVSLDEIKQVVDAVCNGDQIFVIGLYAESYLAQYFGYNLGKIKKNVTIINQDNGDLFNLLLSCTERSVAIIFSFPRYLHRAHEIGSFFKKKGVTIIGISDSPLAPLKAVSTQLITIPYNYTSFSDPCCAFLLLMQAVIVEYISRDPEKVESRLQEFDEYAAFFNILDGVR